MAKVVFVRLCFFVSPPGSPFQSDLPTQLCRPAPHAPRQACVAAMIDGKGDQQFTNSQKNRRTNVRNYIDLQCQGRSRVWKPGTSLISPLLRTTSTETQKTMSWSKFLVTFRTSCITAKHCKAIQERSRASVSESTLFI